MSSSRTRPLKTLSRYWSWLDSIFSSENTWSVEETSDLISAFEDLRKIWCQFSGPLGELSVSFWIWAWDVRFIFGTFTWVPFHFRSLILNLKSILLLRDFGRWKVRNRFQDFHAWFLEFENTEIGLRETSNFVCGYWRTGKNLCLFHNFSTSDFNFSAYKNVKSVANPFALEALVNFSL